MKKTLLISLMAAVAVLLSSCAVNLGGVMANYTSLQNSCDVNSNFRNGTQRLVIHNQQDFNAVFSSRTGAHASIDFAHKFVVAVILPETNRQTQIETVSCNRIGDKLYFSYLITEGHMTGYTFRPYTAVVVDRSEPIDVVFQQVTPSDLENAGIHRNGNQQQQGGYTPRPRL
ncbi:MAG: hypothetical protein II691_06035 [Muribaculaceae bacterium]|nr:hypothetical protein [Muribaculaceae bacterium]